MDDSAVVRNYDHLVRMVEREKAEAKGEETACKGGSS